ncbi:glycosyltransferase family 4 protein [Hyunsoonleella sp. SJ7]|uniref:Glycosyltransferase family 4 protein n=1 Tax=Hyunsoonleella aquatilis TaxID=2762758 RepID=A0A923KKZ3_9FLAO|nr:glycosyltransferase family 4 protein [Hyunsoonleella aquatilis]MBC3758992.1 glycosyltransferase family 4 protein [Hyunsoonleella aquatilis]
MDKKPRIMLIASLAFSLNQFRGDMIKHLIKNGYAVYGAAPNMDIPKNFEMVKSTGAVPVDIELSRTGLNPIKDIQSIMSLRKKIKKHEINIVFSYTIKPVIYGSIAARSLNIATFSLITGLGYTFSGTSLRSDFLQFFSRTLYRIALKKNKVVIFQNRDDHQLFLDKKILTKSQKYGIVSGSGVNLDEYKFRRKAYTSGKIVFVFVARLIEEKGIKLFIEAASTLKTRYPDAEFHVFGGIPINSGSAIEESILNEAKENNSIIHHGSVSNLQEFLYKSDVFVLPTYYREGIPRSSLEALSVGMPIIITNTPGCKETVKTGENGILIEPRNLGELISAMEFFLKSPEMIDKMGVKSRQYAEERFDVNIINKNLLDIIKNNT